VNTFNYLVTIFGTYPFLFLYFIYNHVLIACNHILFYCVFVLLCSVCICMLYLIIMSRLVVNLRLAALSLGFGLILQCHLPVQEEADWLRLLLFKNEVEYIIKTATWMHLSNSPFYLKPANPGSVCPQYWSFGCIKWHLYTKKDCLVWAVAVQKRVWKNKIWKYKKNGKFQFWVIFT